MTRNGRDAGKALECLTFVELRKRHRDVYYWRAAGEVDFVVQTDDGPTPVQVALDGATERHWRALDAFYETFPHAAEALVVTMENFTDVLARLGPPAAN